MAWIIGYLVILAVVLTFNFCASKNNQRYDKEMNNEVKE